MNTDNFLISQIARHAKIIHEKIKGGKIFGSPIDESNTDSMIIAAYFQGQNDALSVADRSHQDMIDFAREAKG